MRRHLNQSTQPLAEMPVFNNWGVVAEGWYLALPSRDLPRGAARSLTLCGHHVVLFRGEDGQVRCLDGFCPHMGTDLGIGRVDGDQLRCFFHHWSFDGEGRCRDIPCGSPIPEAARLHSWATDERYGFIWVYPAPEAPARVPAHEELEDDEVVWVHGFPYYRSCHHHVTMINGIDPQHLRTVHGIDIEMELSADEDDDRGLADFTLSGTLPVKTFGQRLATGIVGRTYSYRMRYAHGTLGFLTVMKDTYLFGGDRALPELYMIFAYRPDAFGRTLVQPIYLARRRPGVAGRAVQRALLTAMKLGFYVLRDEDGEIYENMRFRPKALLDIDKPVARFIRWVNRLKPSVWSGDMQQPGALSV